MSALVLKLIAAFTMFIDHAGLIVFGNALWMRTVGRLAFPLYAFFIAEGFRHTKSRRRYFLTIFLLGVFCQAVAWIVEPGEILNVLLTFSVSIALMALLEKAKDEPLYFAAFMAALAATFFFCRYVDIDYGFFGIILPLFPAFFTDRRWRHGAFSLGLLLLCANSALKGNYLQSVSLLSALLLLFYNGERGRYKMKYFFYVFYPLHLALLWGIAYLM